MATLQSLADLALVHVTATNALFWDTGTTPTRVVEKAVERMLPRGPLFRQILGNLRVYKGAEHPHTAQQPEVLDVAALNTKNVRH